MSIALHAKVKELEERVKHLEHALSAVHADALRTAQVLAEAHQAINELKNRPKPGRPPKNG